MELTLTLPFLLEAEAGRLTTRGPAVVMPRVVERETVRIARLLEGPGVLLAEHEDDRQALWPYGRLLWRHTERKDPAASST